VRIAVPEHVADLPTGIGHGRVWRSVLGELRRLADVRVTAPGARRVKADAWLIDGHNGPVETALPVVAQVHETSWRIPEVRDSMHPAFLEWLEGRTLAAVASASRLITATQATREQIAGFCSFPAERIDVVAHGVDPTRFAPGPSPRERPYVLFAATVHPRKNLAGLRAAMEALWARGLPHELVVVAGPATDRPDSAELEAAAFAAPVVRVERPSDAELAALMAGCDAFCLPSLWEGFGMTALEAMACGAAVVVADRGALPEVVGDAGLTCEPTPDGIEAALHAVLTDDALRARLRRDARARAEQMTWERTARGWLASIERAVAG
jgi:glycosyltransferase involved in cell wall biosynthesis